MNTSGEVADLMVKEGLMLTEEAAKLTGLGAKNLAAIIIALLKEDNNLHGATNLKKLLKSEKKLCVLQIRESDIKRFNNAAKKYGVLFTAVKDKKSGSGLCDIIAKQEDVTQLNFIMEKLEYAAPADYRDKESGKESPEESERGENESKKFMPRAEENPQEKEFTKRGDTEKTDSGINGKPSVRKRIENIKLKHKNLKNEKLRSIKKDDKSR